MAVKKSTKTAAPNESVYSFTNEELQLKLNEAYRAGVANTAERNVRQTVREEVDGIWAKLGTPDTFAIQREPDGSVKLTADWKN